MALKKFSIPMILLGFGTVPVAHAEGDPLVFADVFGGYSWSQDQDLQVRTTVGGAPSNINADDLDVSSNAVFGGRIGAWLQSHPSIGLAVDATRFDTDFDRQSANVSQVGAGFTGTGRQAVGDIRIANVLVAFDLIVRHRGERFTPYAMFGPGLMFSSIDDSNGWLALQNDDTDVSFGYKAGAGLSYRISDTMHLFTEYRYIHGSPEYEQNADDRLAMPTTTVNADVEADIDSHLIVGGLSIRF